MVDEVRVDWPYGGTSFRNNVAADQILKVSQSDLDMDGISDGLDTCPFVANPEQQTSTQAGFEAIGCACLCGDVNLDCAINGADAIEIQRSAAFEAPQLLFDPDHCDVNADGTCNAADALEIQLFSAFAPPQLAFSPTNCPFNQAP